MTKRVDALASISRSMWGMVTPDLRAVAFELTDKQLTVRFVYAGSPSEDQLEMVSVAEAECVADFWQSHEVSYIAQTVAVTEPLTISDTERWVYLRHEAE